MQIYTIAHEPFHRLVHFVRISTHVRILFYRVSGAVLPYEQIVAPMLSEGMYGGIGKKSIGYPRKVYRVFPESL